MKQGDILSHTGAVCEPLLMPYAHIHIYIFIPEANTKLVACSWRVIYIKLYVHNILYKLVCICISCISYILFIWLETHFIADTVKPLLHLPKWAHLFLLFHCFFSVSLLFKTFISEQNLDMGHFCPKHVTHLGKYSCR